MTRSRLRRQNDLPALELLPVDSHAEAEIWGPVLAARPRWALHTFAPSSARPRRGRLVRVAVVAVVATIFGAAVTHRYEQSTRPVAPPWIQACRAAIDATARLQREHDIELDEAMKSTWALAAGLPVQAQPIGTSSIAVLQRDADIKTRDCVSPTDPTHSR
jgi:hypothetical protein